VVDLTAAKVALDASRPTAVNLMWATGRIVEVAAAYAGAPGMTADGLRGHVLSEALALAEEDVAINTSIATHGNAIVPHKANILHHW
jgi:methylthioribose-1-phosphate isomerase